MQFLILWYQSIWICVNHCYSSLSDILSIKYVVVKPNPWQFEFQYRCTMQGICHLVQSSLTSLDHGSISAFVRQTVYFFCPALFFKLRFPYLHVDILVSLPKISWTVLLHICYIFCTYLLTQENPFTTMQDWLYESNKDIIFWYLKIFW